MRRCNLCLTAIIVFLSIAMNAQAQLKKGHLYPEQQENHQIS